MATATKTLTKRFLVSYAGEVEYDIGGTVYKVRYWGNPDGSWNDGVWEGFIRPSIGTVRHDKCELFHTFPPPEVVALFPGFVGARYTEDWKTEYDGPTPKLRPLKNVPCYIGAEGTDED